MTTRTARGLNGALVCGLVVVGVAGLAGCGQPRDGAVREMAGTAVSEARTTVGAQVTGTLQAKGEDVRSTVAAGVAALTGTVESRVTAVGTTAVEAAGTVTAAQQTVVEIASWTRSAAAAVITVTNQARDLRDDPALIDSAAWRASTSDVVAQMATLAMDGEQMADQLATNGALPGVQSALEEAAGRLAAAATGLQTALDDRDADAFLNETKKVEALSSVMDLLQLTVDKLKNEG